MCKHCKLSQKKPQKIRYKIFLFSFAIFPLIEVVPIFEEFLVYEKVKPLKWRVPICLVHFIRILDTGVHQWVFLAAITAIHYHRFLFQSVSFSFLENTNWMMPLRETQKEWGRVTFLGVACECIYMQISKQKTTTVNTFVGKVLPFTMVLVRWWHNCLVAVHQSSIRCSFGWCAVSL